uniref:Uncharacterized protein n=1 Tax=Callithrix jacchus TaxID=9483 RepID=A0A8I3WC45_CALJA
HHHIRAKPLAYIKERTLRSAERDVSQRRQALFYSESFLPRGRKAPQSNFIPVSGWAVPDSGASWLFSFSLHEHTESGRINILFAGCAGKDRIHLGSKGLDGFCSPTIKTVFTSLCNQEAAEQAQDVIESSLSLPEPGTWALKPDSTISKHLEVSFRRLVTASQVAEITAWGTDKMCSSHSPLALRMRGTVTHIFSSLARNQGSPRPSPFCRTSFGVQRLDGCVNYVLYILGAQQIVVDEGNIPAAQSLKSPEALQSIHMKRWSQTPDLRIQKKYVKKHFKEILKRRDSSCPAGNSSQSPPMEGLECLITASFPYRWGPMYFFSWLRLQKSTYLAGGIAGSYGIR